MFPRPVALGLVICDRAITEEGTRNVTLVNTFTLLRANVFPTPPQRLAVFSALTDGLGEAIIELAVTRLETDRVVYQNRSRIRFPNRLMEVRALFRIDQCSFPAAGRYQFTLLVDDEWVAHRNLQVLFSGDQP